MHKFFKSLGISLVGISVMIVTGSLDAAETGRAGYNIISNGMMNGNTNARTSSQRMPTMPTLPGNSMGNISTSIPSNNNGGGGDKPNPKPEPEPKPECPDGGVKNSTYTIENCMNDVLSCINNGALPGGLNDMFNEDVRNSIVNGMNLCYLQVDKCVSDVRRDCRNVYLSPADVWIDFNSRKVQPEYYNFILRKTGLTPNQAENTCWLLDKNTYGSSFSAVSNAGTVTSEYAKQVGAYNLQNSGSLSKANPQGVNVNNGNPGVDGQRGHYARWDATTGDCLIRVAAYNKDTHIKNSWLFGAAGNDKPAEVWRSAGSSFQCNKDLFGFSLLNDTSTAAVVGVGGGTLVGTGVGAIVGHGNRDFDCSIKSHRKELTSQLRSAGNTYVLNEYLDGMTLSPVGDELSEVQCNEVVKLYDVYVQAQSVDKTCTGASLNYKEVVDGGYTEVDVNSANFKRDDNGNIDFTQIARGGKWVNVPELTSTEMQKINDGGTITIRLDETLNIDQKITSSDGCPKFHGINYAKRTDNNIYCTASVGCISGQELDAEVRRLGRVLDGLTILRGEKSNMGKSILIGAGVGAGAGGLATAITAFVEKGNISCRIGDNLETVNFGKSHNIGSLKDFYVKWNLRLPDTIMPTAQVVDCASWKNACETLKDYNSCTNARINYRPADAKSTTLIDAACTVSGSVCIENYPVAKSYGACE